MKNPVAQLSGYKINEYLLILNPHEDLSKKILKLREEYKQKHNPNYFVTKPNIPIVRFTQYELYEQRIKDNLHRIAQGMQPVKIELKDFGSFPSHTIFINVPSKLPFQSIAKKVRSETQKLMKFDDDNKPHFFMEPTIAIAQKIPQAKYDQLWLEYSHRHFTGRFIADSMLLLKRPKGEFGYQIADSFKFENLYIGVEQGQLF